MALRLFLGLLVASTFVSSRSFAERDRGVPRGPGGPPSQQLRLILGRPTVAGVFLNGAGPFRFLLDTGAQTNQVEQSLARQLGLRAVFRTALVTAGGTVLMAGGRIDEVSLGAVKACDQEFLFTELTGVHALSPEIQGVLGQEFLSRFDYLIDFANGRLTFGTAPPEGRRLRVETIDGRPAIATSEGKLVLDSGTDTAILFRSSGSATIGRILTASGPAFASIVQGLMFRIDGQEYRPANAAFLPRGVLVEDGVLPASLFHAVFVSNSGGYAILDPGAKSRSGTK